MPADIYLIRSIFYFTHFWIPNFCTYNLVLLPVPWKYESSAENVALFHSHTVGFFFQWKKRWRERGGMALLFPILHAYIVALLILLLILLSIFIFYRLPYIYFRVFYVYLFLVFSPLVPSITQILVLIRATLLIFCKICFIVL